MTPAEIRDVRTLISILREVVGENDVMMIAAIVSEEAELAMGSTDLPMVRQLAHELIDIAEKALAALERGKTEMTFEKFYESLREGKSLTNNNGLTYVRIEDGVPVVRVGKTDKIAPTSPRIDFPPRGIVENETGYEIYEKPSVH